MAKLVLYHEERGDGTPLVLLHGFPFDHSIWRQQLDEVSKETRVLAPDLPGFGKSDPLPDAEPAMDDYAGRIAQWADEIGLVKFVLVGHSMGGYIAFAFAKLYPERLSGLGLVCTRPGPDSEQTREGRYAMIKQVLDKGPQATVDAMLPNLFAQRTKEKKQDIVEGVKQTMLRQKAEGIVYALRAMASRPDSIPLLGKIDVPTLVVSGAEDRIIPQQEADLMASTIPGARQETIDSAGHLPMLERPDKLNPMLADLARGSREAPALPEPPDPQDIATVRTRS